MRDTKKTNKRSKSCRLVDVLKVTNEQTLHGRSKNKQIADLWPDCEEANSRKATPSNNQSNDDNIVIIKYHDDDPGVA